MAKTTKFQLANPNIDNVLERFLNDNCKKLKPSTIRKYGAIIDLFKHSLNNYAYQSLNKDECKLFNELYNAVGESHREFIELGFPI